MDGTHDDRTKKPRAWGKSLDVLKAVGLERVADEVNRRRLKRLRQKIAGPLSERERKKMRRLIALDAEGRLEELPSDLRANASRMKRILLLIFLKVGARASWSFKVGDLAEEFGETSETVRRGILDLEEACLIEVTRKQHHWKGGWWKSEYRLVWPNLSELAEGRDVQRSLFDGGDAPVRAEGFQPVEPVGQGPGDGSTLTSHDGLIPRCEKSTSHHENLISHSEESTSHCEDTTSHSDRATSHCGRSYNAQARTPASSFSSSFQSSIPPSSFSARAEKKKDFEGGRQTERRNAEPCDRPEWGSVRSRLQPLIAAWPKAINNAAEQGWSPSQAEQLLDQFDQHAVGDVRAWKVGSLYWQLTNGAPGTLIDMPPCDAYVRARRDQKLAAARDAVAARAAAQAAKKETEGERASNLESRFGALLDQLEGDPLDRLIAEACPATFHQKQCRKYAQSQTKRFGLYRDDLLRLLERDAECQGANAVD